MNCLQLSLGSLNFCWMLLFYVLLNTIKKFSRTLCRNSENLKHKILRTYKDPEKLTMKYCSCAREFTSGILHNQKLLISIRIKFLGFTINWFTTLLFYGIKMARPKIKELRKKYLRKRVQLND